VRGGGAERCRLHEPAVGATPCAYAGTCGAACQVRGVTGGAFQGLRHPQDSKAVRQCTSLPDRSASVRKEQNAAGCTLSPFVTASPAGYRVVWSSTCRRSGSIRIYAPRCPSLPPVRMPSSRGLRRHPRVMAAHVVRGAFLPETQWTGRYECFLAPPSSPSWPLVSSPASCAAS